MKDASKCIAIALSSGTHDDTYGYNIIQRCRIFSEACVSSLQ